ncbi:MAG: T9SS type A sorting domain-containing protein [Saprospiraceae bacterium]|nr:T9SS type A sorting domain-containing protein [Saprospiraceae bacterium]
MELLDQGKIKEYQWYDAQGRLILSKNLSDFSNTNQLDVSQLPSGAYHLKVLSENKTYTRSILVH